MNLIFPVSAASFRYTGAYTILKLGVLLLWLAALCRGKVQEEDNGNTEHHRNWCCQMGTLREVANVLAYRVRGHRSAAHVHVRTPATLIKVSR